MESYMKSIFLKDKYTRISGFHFSNYVFYDLNIFAIMVVLDQSFNLHPNKINVL